MNRKQAIELLSKEQLKIVDKNARESHILNWWVLDNEDEEFQLLSSSLQLELLENEDFLGDAMDSRYDELIILGLSSSYKGVTNEFISQNLGIIKGENFVVTGAIEALYPCPCCSYDTLDTVGEYEICPLCFWEDDGSNEVNICSSANGKSLAQARAEFILSCSSKPLFKYRYSNEKLESKRVDVLVKDSP